MTDESGPRQKTGPGGDRVGAVHAGGDKPRLLLHIGVPKTGSTALQRFLFENAAHLIANDWSYPDVSLRGYGHHDLAFVIAGGYPDWAIPADVTMQDLVGRLAAAGATAGNLLISSENFYLLTDPARVAQTLEQAGIVGGRTVTVVVYLRRQDDAHASWYNQRVKAQGFAGTVSDSIREHEQLWDYDTMLGRWAEAFGADNLVVRCYDTAVLVGGDIRLDFLDVMQIDAPPGALPPARVNTSLSRDLLEIQRIINTLPLAAVEKRRFHRPFMALSASAPAGSDTVLSNDQRRELIARYAPGNRRVAERYLGREELFGGALPYGAASAENWTGLAVEDVVRVFGWLLCRTTDEA